MQNHYEIEMNEIFGCVIARVLISCTRMLVRNGFYCVATYLDIFRDMETLRPRQKLNKVYKTNE